MNWHYLTGAAEAVQAINEAVGFRDRANPERNTFDHPTGVVFASPRGLVSSYLLGVGYQAADVRLAVSRAATGASNTAATPVLLLCYDYDPKLGRYTLAIMKLLRLATAITVMMIAGAVFLAIRRERRT